VNAEDLASDDRSDGEGVENIDEGLPGLDVGTPFTLVVEPVHCLSASSISLWVCAHLL
jgi:hypothetical protein